MDTNFFSINNSYKNQTMDTLQASLFEFAAQTGLTIESASQKANVSSATIRNWIKTGYLKQNSSGNVDIGSFENFLDQVAGQEKLVGRANKSLKDSHDHDGLTTEFVKKISNLEFDIEYLVEKYESALSDSFKNREGIYYTPSHIVFNLLQGAEKSNPYMTFLDPCCGSGNFILRAIELGLQPKNIFGFDTDPVAVEFTKRRIYERTGYTSKNIIVGDFLDEALKPTRKKFDFIYTNPPWGKKLSKEEKGRFGKLFQSGKNVDTCSLFFFACLGCLDIDGELGLLLPDSFFNIATFETARVKALSYDMTRLVDYEKPFKGLMTKAFAFVLKKRVSDKNLPSVYCETKGKGYSRSANSFLKNPKSIINFQCDSASAEVIEHVFSIPHLTLLGRAQWGLGIVTGNNKKFSRSTARDGYIPVFRGADIKQNGLLNPEVFIPSDLTLYQQVAPAHLYAAKVKLIYKFISSDLCFFCDTQQRYILNSANMLIPGDDFPISANQLCSLLNSDFLNWLFSQLFKTHKVLRGDLEMMPIHSGYFQDNLDFQEDRFLNFLSIERDDDGSYRIKK